MGRAAVCPRGCPSVGVEATGRLSAQDFVVQRLETIAAQKAGGGEGGKEEEAAAAPASTWAAPTADPLTETPSDTHVCLAGHFTAGASPRAIRRAG